MMLGTGAKERDSLVQRLEKPLLARGAVTSAVIAMPMAFCRCWAIVLMLLCLCIPSWAACWHDNNTCPNSAESCNTYDNCGGNYCGNMGGASGCTVPYGDGYQYYTNCYWGVTNGMAANGFAYGSISNTDNCWREWATIYKFCSTVCSTQAEMDSVYCAQNPTAEGCVEEDVPENCQHDYSVCMAVGGVWEKIGSDASGCASTCNICNSKQQVRNLNRWNAVCCAQGDAPPPQDAICTAPAVPSGRGMSMSRLLADGGEVGCGATQTADGEPIVENAELFKRFCIDGEQYEDEVDTNSVNSSGSGDSSSSGEGGGVSNSGTSFGTELEALDGVYGVLDTIRDTLVKRLTPATEEIRDCLYSFKLCTQLDSLYVDWSAMPKDSTWFYIDTGLVKYLRPFMDASVALDSNQLKAIRKLDTNALKQLRLDSALLENDTSTRRAVNSGFEGVLKNDTVTRRAVNRLDTTVVSLDSSLRKGIREGTDNLIDSMDRYLGRVDSAIGAVGSNGTPLGDSLGKLIGILGGDTGSVGSGAYGDSASAYGDSIRRWIREGDGKWDSAFRATEGEWGVDTIDGLYDSSFAYGTCHGDDCPPCTDSDCLGKITPGILKYGDSIAAQLGDSLVKNVKAQEDSLPTMWDSAMVKLRKVSFFSTFDSTFLANVGAKIPNTNTCPEDCFRQQVDGRYAYVAYNMTLDWKLCRPIAPGVLNGLNAFDILKLLARVLTVVTCLSILMWEVSSRRGGGIGL